jgi:intein/homing endonuclease
MMEAERAYIAGLFDGEGTIGIYKTRHNPRLRIRIGMVDKVTLEWVRQRMGGTIKLVRKEEGKRRAVWFWGLYADAEMKDFIDAIVQFSITKQNELVLCRQFLETDDDLERYEIARKVKVAKGRLGVVYPPSLAIYM